MADDHRCAGKRVCIIQPVMKQYRLPFFLALHRALREHDIDLEVVYGSPWADERSRGDNTDLPAPIGRRVSTWKFGRRLFVHPVVRPWLGSDLVVLEHANKHALNHLLTALRSLGFGRLAYWGHGCDRQADPDSWGERFKRRSLHWVDWWFSYTATAARYVQQQGFPAERITVVENAIDTRALQDELASITASELTGMRARLGWQGDERVALFCGSLYRNKRLDLLFDAALRVRQTMPDFSLLIIGDGALAPDTAAFAAAHPQWVRYVGAKFGREKAVLLKLSELWLNPGVVGLGVLDAFCAGLPVLTTTLRGHGPEIEYLDNRHNGLLVPPNPADLANSIIDLMTDRSLHQHLRDGAISAARRYSIETMVANFVRGIRQSLVVS